MKNCSNNQIIKQIEVEEEGENLMDKIVDIRKKMPDEQDVYNLAEFFKMFGNPTRAKILYSLHLQDLYVGEIADVVGMSISAVSHQLWILRAAKLIKCVKEGKEVKYSLDDDHVNQIMTCGMTHVKEQ